MLLNFSAEIFFWTILQLRFNENVWNYYIHQKEFVDWQSIKILIYLKYLILGTPYTFFSCIQLAFSFYTHNLFLFCLKYINRENVVIFLSCLFVQLLKKENIFKYFLHLFSTVSNWSTLILHEVFWDYQINLENTANLNSTL